MLATVTVYSQNAATPQNQGSAQAPSPSPTPTPINWSTDPTLKRFVFRSIGPASMGGRIDDFAVPEQNPYVIYVGFATMSVSGRPPVTCAMRMNRAIAVESWLTSR